MIRNTPLYYGERLNRDFGIYAQDSWRVARLTVNAGIRWENVKAQFASESPAGPSPPTRSTADIESLPNWKDWAPRFGVVYDLMGNGRTAIKCSLNRYNQIRATGIAANYNPFLSQTVQLPWRTSTATTSPKASEAAPVPTRRMRDRLHNAVLELRNRGAQRVWQLPACVEPRERARSSTRVGAPAVRCGSWFKGTSTT